jgi:hypothetical protein
MELVGMEAPQDLFSIFGEIWLAYRRDGPSEESRLPLDIPGFAIRCLLPLFLFDFLLERRCKAVLSIYNGIRHAFPELAGFVRELLFYWGNDLRYGVERIKVDQKVFLLEIKAISQMAGHTMKRDKQKLLRRAGCQAYSKPCLASSLRPALERLCLEHPLSSSWYRYLDHM